MIHLTVLRTFIAVLDHGSIIEASRNCGYSPAAVSRQMSALQARLGVRLFEPDGRGIRPRPIAEELAVGARRLLDECDQFDDYAKGLCTSQNVHSLVLV
ncbi:LysR family transcriptional regulator [Microbacterium lacus]|uniref:LysR family transcriptional regulator n=1 Tax=Microbacterium lacus TaxID=415217 RepID=UPI00384B0204